MPSRTNIDLEVTGVDEVQRALRLTTAEMERAIRTATSRAGQRARATASRSFRQAGVGRTTIKRRIRGQGGRLWIGANPVTATLQLRGGVLMDGEFPLPVGGLPRPRQPIFRRDGRRIYPVPFPIANVARTAAQDASDAALERFDEALESEALKVLERAANRAS